MKQGCEALNVLILDGNENQAVASVRSLARAGHSVQVGSSTSWSKAGWSRFCTSTFVYPSPEQSVSGFLDAIVREVKQHENALVLPMTEQTTLPLSGNRDLIQQAGGHLVLPSHEKLIKAFDKKFTSELAHRLGIATPRTVVVETKIDPDVAKENLEFPVVLKPSSSQEVSQSGDVARTGPPLYASNDAEFRRAFLELRKRASTILIQEYVVGTGIGYFALFNKGELRAEFSHKRLRDVRPTGSGSSLRVSTPVSHQVREAGLAILRELQWHGVAMVEFRLRGETPVFLEVNGRFWNSLPLAVYSGADFPGLLVQMFENGDIPIQTSYQTGVKCRWFLGDFRHLLEVWRGAPEGYPGSFPNRVKTLIDFVRPERGTFHDNFTLSDPLPELGDWLDFFCRKLPNRLHKPNVSRSSFHAEGNYSRT